VQIVAFSEGLLLAEHGGVDRELAVEVMGSSPIGSPMLKARAPLILDLPDEAWFDVELMHKDIRLALATGQREHVPLPSAAVADELLTSASKLGHGHHDIAALYDALAQTAADMAQS
jgi:3-hydroxyisobutyrate dehydrogenase-like beta-hydroxyacid dehydrogenase